MARGTFRALRGTFTYADNIYFAICFGNIGVRIAVVSVVVEGFVVDNMSLVFPHVKKVRHARESNAWLNISFFRLDAPRQISLVAHRR